MVIKIQREGIVDFVKLDHVGEDEVPPLGDLRVTCFVEVGVSAGILHFDVMVGKDVNVDGLAVFGEGGDEHFDEDVVLFVVAGFFGYLFDEMWFPLVDPDIAGVFVFELDKEGLGVGFDGDEIGNLDSRGCTE